jgi:phosphotransferase system enzyme I (PtsI)
VFIGMGMDALSMSPANLLEMKRLVRSVSYEEARRCAREVLRLPTAGEIDCWLRKHFEKRLVQAEAL